MSKEFTGGNWYATFGQGTGRTTIKADIGYPTLPACNPITVGVVHLPLDEKGEYDYEQAEANARLFAASKQLLEGCRAAMATFNKLVARHPELISEVNDAWHAVSHAATRVTSEAYSLLNQQDGSEKYEQTHHG